jgi:MFS family permease
VNRGFARLWTASAISNLGDGVTIVAGPLLAASLTRDPRLVAGLTFAATLPWLLFALAAGAIIDRVDRRRLMWITDAARAGVMLTVALVVAADEMRLPLLYALFFLLGVGEILFDNAATAILPSVVSAAELPRANGRLFGTETIANQLLGPPLGGALFAVTAAAPFVLDAGSFAASAVLLATLRGRFRPEPAVEGPSTLRGQIGEGLRWLLGQRLLRSLAAMLAVWNFASGASFGIIVLFADERLGVTGAGFGVLLGVAAAGTALGGLVSGRVIKRLGDTLTLRLVIFIAAGSAAVIALTRDPIVAAAMLAFGGLAGVTWNVITISLRQELVPDRLLGRVIAAYRVLGVGSMPLGALVGGFVARRFGLPAPFWVEAVLLGLVGLTALRIVTPPALAAARRSAR